MEWLLICLFIIYILLSDVFMSQLTALKTSRSVKTRRLTVAEEDRELGKMARLAGVCREIFSAITAAKGILLLLL